MIIFFRPGDKVRLKSERADPRPAPDGLRRGELYTVEQIVSDRLMINGQLYFVSRFILVEVN